MKKFVSLLLVGIISVTSFVSWVSANSYNNEILKHNHTHNEIVRFDKFSETNLWDYEYAPQNIWKIAQQLFKIANKLRDPRAQRQMWETLQRYTHELAEKVDDVAEAIGNGWRSVMLHMQDALWRISATASEMRKIWDDIIDFFY